ncbi:MAG: ferrochelatase [Verrucomicrobiales bacterium]|jgi:ferrochelatase|nr:ferrochelatase [Verrucomicrobiales bacterium]
MNHRAVLLVNLGSPDSPSAADVRRYLREFLMDEHVIDSGLLTRWFVVNCLILPRRPAVSARNYQKIWTSQGSPLTVAAKNLQRALQQQTARPVALGMRYGKPSIAGALAELRAAHPQLEEILLIPLYPHYTVSTWETAVAKTRAELSKLRWNVRLAPLPPFYRQPAYLNALTVSIREHLTVSDYLLFSYHGVPQRHLRHRFPNDDADYREQCHFTTEQTARRLALPAGGYSTSFQSRFGGEPWCEPYTDKELIRLADSGVKNIAVVCPSFVADCLETLEEIGLTGRRHFLARGGQTFQLIPCLNEHPLWMNALRDWAGL